MTETTEQLPFTPRLRDLLSTAEAIAAAAGQHAVGAEHLQLAILGDTGAIPTQVLSRLGWTTEFAEHLRALLASDGYNGGSNRPGSLS